jgi:hypothetical protein
MKAYKLMFPALIDSEGTIKNLEKGIRSDDKKQFSKAT